MKSTAKGREREEFFFSFSYMSKHSIVDFIPCSTLRNSLFSIDVTRLDRFIGERIPLL